MKIAIIGADGQLGSDLVKVLDKKELLPLYYPDFDVTKPKEARAQIEQLKPEILINTSAYHRVDDCEDNRQK